MALRLVCTCGYVIEGASRDDFWQNVQDHMGRLHPELAGNLSRDDIFAQAEVL
jgi:hypothetical protein